MIRISRVVLALFWMAMPFFYAQAQDGYLEESVWSNVNPASGNASDFIVKNDGTKVYGEILRTFDFTDYDKIEFTYQGDTKTYFPDDIQAFGLTNGRFFMSKKLTETSALEFVQILFSGKLQLDYRKGVYYIDNGVEVQQLRAYYQDVTVDGEKRRRHIKLYISILKILTSGNCGFEMKDLIEKSRLDEQDFIKILTQYHACEKLPYKLHVEKIPFANISPIVGAGLGTLSIKSFENEYGRASRINNPFSFQLEAGIKFHDFRRSPRLGFDLRVEYHRMSGVWSTSQANSSILVTGSQEFKQSSILIPFSVNYSVYKRDDLDFYFGLSAGLQFNSQETQDGFVDFTYLPSNETYISTMELVDINPSVFVPGLKLGGSIPVGQKSRIYVEIQAEYAKEMYLTYLPNSTNVGYHSTLVSFNVGFEF